MLKNKSKLDSKNKKSTKTTSISENEDFNRSSSALVKHKILLVASEAIPFVKTGGLADVCGALVKNLKARGHDVRLVLPRYWSIDRSQMNLKPVLSPMGVAMGNQMIWCEVFETLWKEIPVYLIEHEHYFGRRGIYDDGQNEYSDNGERFGFFCKATLQLCRDLEFRPDIIHCNDWQTALIPAYLKDGKQNDSFFNDTASVFSIHNIGYQGFFKKDVLPFLGIDGFHFNADCFESFGGINVMKGALFFADAINTVSPTYAQEILGEPGGSGLSVYLNRRKEDLCGILNGADYEDWDPEIDELIPAKYSHANMKGKAECKKVLQAQFHLEENPDIPVIGVVSRFAEQKGLDLLAAIIKNVVNDMRVQFVIVGSGEKQLEDFFGGLPAEISGKIGAWIGYDNRKAHLVEAGSDFHLMPSRYEPCGLNQMYGLKYGTLPIVRATGGLSDTVEQYSEESGKGTGFIFGYPDAKALYDTIGWAVSTYYDRPKHFKDMQSEAMQRHFSWNDSVVKYETLYERALKRRATWK
jgi:starch synthase